MQHTCMNPMTFASHPGLLPQNADSSDIVGHHGPRPSPSSLNLSLLHASVHVIHTAKPLYVFAAAAAHVFVVLALAVIVHSQGSWWMHGQCMFRKTKKRVCTVLRETHTCIIHACMNPMMFASHPVTQASCRKLRTSSDIVGHHGPRPSPSSLNLSLLHASVHVIHAAKPLYVFAAAAAAAHVFVVLALRSLCIRRARGGVEPRLPGTQGFRTQVGRNAMPVPRSAQGPRT